ncbi:MAG: Na+/H+ antiporter subunit E [Candidatus Aminicenantes bacterium]|nr:Na+/H+ antiporter subunit E [Candidatus Aminicenantes bacterium]
MRAKAILLQFILMMGVWLLLSGRVTFENLAAGAIVALVITMMTTSRTSMLGEIRLTPRALGAHLLFFLVFLRELIRSNLDVARRVLSPSLPIHPGIVKVKTRLRSPLGRFVLANAITLTPGTFTVDIMGDSLFIHWLDMAPEDAEAAARHIVSRFEKYLEVAYG